MRRYLTLLACAMALAAALLAGLRAWPKASHVASGKARDAKAVSAAEAAKICDRYAAPNGHDRARGTARRPLRHAQRLVDVLRPGQTGCLRAGVYEEDVTVSHSRITLRNQPGQRARLVGRLWVRHESHDSQVRGLVLDGRSGDDLPSPTINGAGTRFIGNDVSNGHSGICFILGSASYGRARGTVIRDNRIHDCGRLPPQNHDHGIYVAFADDTRIIGNWIYDNADRGIQLYPDAQRTRIKRNVIDGNGEGVIFSGDGGTASSDNLVAHNVIANSRVRADVEAFWPEDTPVGHDNVLRHNCVGGGNRAIDRRGGGFVAHDNVIAHPRYAGRGHGNLRVVGPRACVALLR